MKKLSYWLFLLLLSFMGNQPLFCMEIDNSEEEIESGLGPRFDHFDYSESEGDLEDSDLEDSDLEFECPVTLKQLQESEYFGQLDMPLIEKITGYVPDFPAQKETKEFYRDIYVSPIMNWLHELFLSHSIPIDALIGENFTVEYGYFSPTGRFIFAHGQNAAKEGVAFIVDTYTWEIKKMFDEVLQAKEINFSEDDAYAFIGMDIYDTETWDIVQDIDIGKAKLKNLSEIYAAVKSKSKNIGVSSSYNYQYEFLGVDRAAGDRVFYLFNVGKTGPHLFLKNVVQEFQAKRYDDFRFSPDSRLLLIRMKNVGYVLYLKVDTLIEQLNREQKKLIGYFFNHKDDNKLELNDERINLFLTLPQPFQIVLGPLLSSKTRLGITQTRAMAWAKGGIGKLKRLFK